MHRRIGVLISLFGLAGAATAQSQSPNVSQVLLYSGTTPNFTVPTYASGGFNTSSTTFNLPLAVPSIFSETGTAVNLADPPSVWLSTINGASNYSVSRSFVQLSSAVNASIATALSIVPLSSPASGVIFRKDPATGADLPENSTLGPIFTERAETIGKGRFYIGFSNQDYHFTKFDGSSLNALSILYPGGDPAKVTVGSAQATAPATFGVGMDVRLSQDITFLTYGVTDKLDVSVGLPVVHAAVAARTYNGMIYAGNGFASNGSKCWCVDTFTPGYATLEEPLIGQSALGKTGFGDLLVRVKGTVFRSKSAVIGVGGDIRFPTGNEADYLGVGTTTVKPFAAVSFYSRPMAKGIVLSPHFDIGWQFGGKSTLGGQFQGTTLSQNTSVGSVSYIGAPFITTKNYLPDVLTWAAGAEVALGRHNTIVADILANQVGLVHGIPNAVMQTITGVTLPTSVNGDPTGAAVPTTGNATGLVGAGTTNFGQYFASFGYKVRIVGNLVANANLLIRLDNNGLVAKTTPSFGIGYGF